MLVWCCVSAVAFVCTAFATVSLSPFCACCHVELACRPPFLPLLPFHLLLLVGVDRVVSGVSWCRFVVCWSFGFLDWCRLLALFLSVSCSVVLRGPLSHRRAQKVTMEERKKKQHRRHEAVEAARPFPFPPFFFFPSALPIPSHLRRWTKRFDAVYAINT